MTKLNKHILIIVFVLALCLALTLLCSCKKPFESRPYIVAEYIESSEPIYEADSWDTIKKHIKVKYVNTDGTVIGIYNFNVSGILQGGRQCSITVEYQNLMSMVNVWVMPLEKYLAKFFVDDVLYDAKVFTNPKHGQINAMPEIPEKEGYNGAWERTKTSIFNGEYTVEYTATYTGKDYIVTFDYNGATDNNEISTMEIRYKDYINDLPRPTKGGYVFVGWCIDEKYVNVFDRYDYMEDITLHAKWWDKTVPSEGLTFTLNDDGQSYSVSGLNLVTDRIIVIPDLFESKPVTTINTSINESSIEGPYSLYIPASVSEVKRNFLRDSLREINYGGSLTDWINIEFDSDSNNPLSKLWCKLYIDDKLVTGIEIPDGVQEIKDYAFYGYSYLKSVTIPQSVNQIGDHAFLRCYYLESIIIDKNNSRYSCEGNCLIDNSNKTLLVGCTDSVIPNGIEIIGNYAFDNKILDSIDIPNTVITIGDYAFAHSSIKQVEIPASVKTIGENAFMYCLCLTNITVDSANDIYYSEGNCVIEKESKTVIKAAQDATLPNDILEIGRYAFEYSSVTEIVIPDSVTVIQDYAFHSCARLTSVIIPANVTSIGQEAFSACMGLTSIEFKGTIEQWNKIKKGGEWRWMVSTTKVICSDGEIEL